MRAEKVRADSRQAATGAKIENGRSIECEFDHLFLVGPWLTIGNAACGSSILPDEAGLQPPLEFS
jgi:hypothetical protein